MIVRGVPNFGAPLALYMGTMRRKPDIAQEPDLRIEVVGAKEPRPNAWTEALSYLADCLVELLQGRQAESSNRGKHAA